MIISNLSTTFSYLFYYIYDIITLIAHLSYNSNILNFQMNQQPLEYKPSSHQQPYPQLSFNYQQYQSPKHFNNTFKAKEMGDNRQRIHEDKKINARQRYQSVNEKGRIQHSRGHSLLGNNLPKSKQMIDKANNSLLRYHKHNQPIFEQEKAENCNQQGQMGFSRRSSSQSIGLYRQKFGNKSWVVDQVTCIEEEGQIGCSGQKKWVSKIQGTNEISVVQTIKEIIQQYKQAYWQPILPQRFLQYAKFPMRLKQHILQHRHIVLGILVNYHRTMKLPIEALFIAVNILDRYIQKKSVSNISQEELSSIIDLDNTLKQWNQGIFHIREMAILGITCLYMSHKIEKYKVYHINSWMKHLTLSNVPLLSLALPELCEQSIHTPESIQDSKSRLLKRVLALQGQVFCTLEFNLWKPNIYQILLELQCVFNNGYFLSAQKCLSNSQMNSPIKRGELSPEKIIPKFFTEEQFYFCQYLLQICLFCDFSFFEEQNSQMKKLMPIKTIDIALSVIYIGLHFFRRQSSKEIMGQLISKIYLETEIDQEKTLHHIKKLGNRLFKIVLNEKPVYFSGILEKYAKQHNFGISKFRYRVAQEKSNSENCLNTNSKYQEVVSPRNGIKQMCSIHRSQFSNFSSSETDLMMMRSGS